MIDYYANVDWDQTLWIVEGGEMRNARLLDLCLEFREEVQGHPTYVAEGRELVHYIGWTRSRHVVTTFDANEHAEHAARMCWLHELEHNNTQSIELLWDAQQAAEAAGTYVADWNGSRIEDLRYWLRALDKVCEAGDLDPQAYVNMSDLGGVPLPDDVDTCFPVWAMDEKGDMLVGVGADDIENIDNYREAA